MRKRMCGRAVERHRRADADSRDHEADLVDDAVGEDPAHVVLEQRVDDAVEDHVQADPHEDVRARKAPQEHVDRRLGRKGRKEHGAAG